MTTFKCVGDNEEYASIRCGSCSIKFFVPTFWRDDRMETKATFWCPNGHQRCYAESEADKLRRENARLKQREAQLNDCIREEQEKTAQTERRRIALAGQVTKLKKQVRAGACPCCNKVFPDLQAHMSQEHRGFVAQPLDDEKVVDLQKKRNAK